MPIGISPSSLDIALKNFHGEKTLFLQNLDSLPVKIRITPKSQAEHITVSPAEAVIPANSTQAVVVKANSWKDFNTDLEILTQASDPADLTITSGVQIPLTARWQNHFINPTILLAFIFALFVLAAIHLLRLKYRHV